MPLAKFKDARINDVNLIFDGYRHSVQSVHSVARIVEPPSEGSPRLGEGGVQVRPQIAEMKLDVKFNANGAPHDVLELGPGARVGREKEAFLDGDFATEVEKVLKGGVKGTLEYFKVVLTPSVGDEEVVGKHTGLAPRVLGLQLHDPGPRQQGHEDHAEGAALRDATCTRMSCPNNTPYLVPYDEGIYMTKVCIKKSFRHPCVKS